MRFSYLAVFFLNAVFIPGGSAAALFLANGIYTVQDNIVPTNNTIQGIFSSGAPDVPKTVSTGTLGIATVGIHGSYGLGAESGNKTLRAESFSNLTAERLDQMNAVELTQRATAEYFDDVTAHFLDHTPVDGVYRLEMRVKGSADVSKGLDPQNARTARASATMQLVGIAGENQIYSSSMVDISTEGGKRTDSLDELMIIAFAVESGKFDLKLNLMVTSACGTDSYSPTGGCSARAHALESVHIGGLRYFEKSGNEIPLSQLIITSSSGYDYTLPVTDAVSSIPEPSTIGFTVIGAAFLLFVKRRSCSPLGN
jgi:hypothetical protein